ncbi:MAG TPA: hypothetical protein VF516_22935 [Kofleriaceae bacterium]
MSVVLDIRPVAGPCRVAAPDLANLAWNKLGFAQLGDDGPDRQRWQVPREANLSGGALHVGTGCADPGAMEHLAAPVWVVTRCLV